MWQETINCHVTKTINLWTTSLTFIIYLFSTSVIEISTKQGKPVSSLNTQLLFIYSICKYLLFWQFAWRLITNYKILRSWNSFVLKILFNFLRHRKPRSRHLESSVLNKKYIYKSLQNILFGLGNSEAQPWLASRLYPARSCSLEEKQTYWSQIFQLAFLLLFSFPETSTQASLCMCLGDTRLKDNKSHIVNPINNLENYMDCHL